MRRTGDSAERARRRAQRWTVVRGLLPGRCTRASDGEQGAGTLRLRRAANPRGQPADGAFVGELCRVSVEAQRTARRPAGPRGDLEGAAAWVAPRSGRRHESRPVRGSDDVHDGDSVSPRPAAPASLKKPFGGADRVAPISRRRARNRPGAEPRKTDKSPSGGGGRTVDFPDQPTSILGRSAPEKPRNHWPFQRPAGD